MHELAIAESVVDIAVRHAAGRRVVRVELAAAFRIAARLGMH